MENSTPMNSSENQWRLEKDYKEYLKYMEEYKFLHGHYPQHLSNYQWKPFSFEEWKENNSENQWRLEKEYKEYLEYMEEYEYLHGYYPQHLSNGQWTPFSFEEWKEKMRK